MTRPSAQYLRGRRINPTGITGHESAADLIDNAFFAYNAGRLREGCLLFTQRMLEPEVTVGHEPHRCDDTGGSRHEQPDSADGSRLRGLDHFHRGESLSRCPLSRWAWRCTRGARTPTTWNCATKGVVRIYDIFFDYSVLLSTDAFVREVSARAEFQRPMSTAEYHYLLGGYLREREKALGLQRRSVLATAHALEVPIYTSSPGDSSIGMNVAEQALAGSHLRFDVSADVNETAAIVLRRQTHRREERSAHRWRRESQELPAADRAADPGSAGDRREGA